MAASGSGEALPALTFDYAVVGGGSAGCVLANRLSARPGCRVVLVEAGRDLLPGQEPPAILDTYPGIAAFDPANHWNHIRTRQASPGQNSPATAATQIYRQPRIMGGGSSINGQVANRGIPDDYDEWCRLGADGWNWQGVLPYFCKLEQDLDFSGPLHGQDGPVPIHRIPHKLWPIFSHATERALTGQGFACIRDQNGQFEDGHFPIPLSNNGRHRVSAAMAYLDAATRKRPNLEIMSKTELLGLVADRQTVTGITVQRGAAVLQISAREVILSAGAIQSPAILMRAGIGPAAALRALGITVMADLPGVGANLQEHPGVSMSAFLRPGARLHGSTRRHIHLGLRYSSAVNGSPASDMFMMAAAKSAWHPIGERTATLLAWVNKPFGRGRVDLRSADPSIGPVAVFDLVGDMRDMDRLKGAMRLMARLFASPALASQVDAVVPSRYGGFAAALGRRSLRNYLLTAPIALLLDQVPAFRGPLFRTFASGGARLELILRDDDALGAFLRDSVFGQWHACGTCSMGHAADRMAVTDPRSGRVHGLAGLRIVDASVMPSIPRANLNLPVLMVAERMADAITIEDRSA